jgi:hypothetical protein
MTGLVGKDGAFNSAACEITSCGARSPVAGMLANQIIARINEGAKSLPVDKSAEVAVQNAGAKDKGPVQRG